MKKDEPIDFVLLSEIARREGRAPSTGTRPVQLHGAIPLRERRGPTKGGDDLTPQIEEGFKRLGMDAAGAKTAARGRGAGRAAGSLVEAGRRLGLVPDAVIAFARGRDHELREVVQNIAGLPASCFGWVPSASADDPTTWQLQIARSADDGNGTWTPDEDLVRAAVAQLPGIATFGKALDIPAGDLPAVKATLRAAWIACGAPVDEIPLELAREGLRRAFVRVGLSAEAAPIAARGRERSR